MSRKVGRITLAVALILAGVVVLIDNLMGTNVAWYIGRLWPVLIILLGLEWLWTSRNLAEGTRVTADGGAIIMLVIVAVVGSSASAWRPWSGPDRFPRDWHVVEIAPIAPGIFGNVSAEVTREKPLDLNQIRELAVKVSSAAVVVQDGPEAKVELKVRTWGSSLEQAEEYARRFDLDVDGGNRTVVTATRPGEINRFDATVTVTLPRDHDLRLEVTTESGSASVSDRTGPVKLETSSGSAHVARVHGDVDIRTVSGSIEAEQIDGSLAATASSGSVQVRSVSGNMKVGSTSGSITISQPGGEVSAQASSGGITVDAAVVKGDYDLSSSSGSVRLSMPDASQVHVTAKASSGTVSGPAWLTIGEGRNSGSGIQGAGTYKVNIRTSSGSIAIDAH